MLRVSTLEQELLELNSRAISIPLRRGVEVLAFFLENKAVTLKQLLAEVFPDDKPRSAKSYFHQFRHQLRENVEGLEISTTVSRRCTGSRARSTLSGTCRSCGEGVHGQDRVVPA